MTTPARTMSTRAAQAEQTRQQILTTAQRLFSERGYDATSLQMIADEMGLTKAAVYYHFPAKTDILRESMRPGICKLAGLLDEAEEMRSRRARIEHVIGGFVDFLVSKRAYAVMASTDMAAKRHQMDAAGLELSRRALALFFGETPSPLDRACFYMVFRSPAVLPELVDLDDEQLREALTTTLLRILRP